jgi:hypothetical protein
MLNMQQQQTNAKAAAAAAWASSLAALTRVWWYYHTKVCHTQHWGRWEPHNAIFGASFEIETTMQSISLI